MAPERPASAPRNFSRMALRAIFVSTCGSSVYSTPSFSAKSLPTCRRFLWIAGTMMWEGVSPTSWMMYSPRSVSSTSMPAFSRWALRWISSETIDLLLTTVFAPRSARIRAMISRAEAASFARCTVAPALVARDANISTYSCSRSRTCNRSAEALSRSASRSATDAKASARLVPKVSAACRIAERMEASPRALMAFARKSRLVWTSLITLPRGPARCVLPARGSPVFSSHPQCSSGTRRRSRSPCPPRSPGWNPPSRPPGRTRSREASP